MAKEAILSVRHSQGQVLIVDDVITAGTSVQESVDLIRTASATPCGVIVALDRMERGRHEKSAIQDVEQMHRIPVISIINLDNIMDYLVARGDMAPDLLAIKRYRAQYGVA